MGSAVVNFLSCLKFQKPFKALATEKDEKHAAKRGSGLRTKSRENYYGPITRRTTQFGIWRQETVGTALTAAKEQCLFD